MAYNAGTGSDHRDGTGQPRVVSNRGGCRQHIGGQTIPTRMIAASVTVGEHLIASVRIHVVCQNIVDTYVKVMNNNCRETDIGIG